MGVWGYGRKAKVEDEDSKEAKAKGRKGNEKKGSKVFKMKCSQCHTLQEWQPHKQGPNLSGLFERTSGRAEGYYYSPAMKHAGIQWGEDTLFDFLENPKRKIKGIKMVFSGIENPRERRDLIAYLRASTVTDPELN